jgi:hypothetical protein
MNPEFPVFIPTKGRYESRLTAIALDKIGVPYSEVIEENDEQKYKRAGSKNLIIIPQHDKGLVFTRNYIWDYAQSLGVSKFWTIDDNVIGFWRWNKNKKQRVSTGGIFRAIEEFVDRYENVPIAGMNYFMFIKQKYQDAPIRINTRIYSNMLIQTDAKNPYGKPYRNEGFFNDDTDLCLRVLKDGFCTILFNAFLIEKSVTMTVKGGMTPHYQDDGRWKMAEELRRKHPDVTKVTRKWGRWQHQVDYKPFKWNKLKKKPGLVIPEGINNYGMKLVKKDAA